MMTTAQSPDSDVTEKPKYHPLFSFDDADIVLRSRDGVLFRVPSMTLKMTSSWFRTMFTLPQAAPPSTLPSYCSSPTSPSSRPSSQEPFEPEIISLDEESSTLEPLLRMACGLEIPTLDTWDVVEPVLYAAEKYDMVGPSSIIRALLRTQAFADAPLRLYAAACHFGWTEDARAASTGSLTLNLHDPVHRPALIRLRPSDLLSLFELHHNRRAQFRARLGESPFLTDAQLSEAAAPRCPRCREPISYAEWRELKHAMFYELERRPAGDTILTGLDEWPAALACWAVKCKAMRCGSSVYDKVLSSKAIREVLDSLPSAVEMPIHETA
jgi:BTB/POZ domain